jgi:hypothetical protein
VGVKVGVERDHDAPIPAATVENDLVVRTREADVADVKCIDARFSKQHDRGSPWSRRSFIWRGPAE